MTDSLPLRAPSTPPDTGASRKPMPRAAQRRVRRVARCRARRWSGRSRRCRARRRSASASHVRMHVGVGGHAQVTITSQSREVAWRARAARRRARARAHRPCPRCGCRPREQAARVEVARHRRAHRAQSDESGAFMRDLPCCDSCRRFVQVGVAGQAGFQRVEQLLRPRPRGSPAAVDLGRVRVAQVVERRSRRSRA